MKEAYINREDGEGRKLVAYLTLYPRTNEVSRRQRL